MSRSPVGFRSMVVLFALSAGCSVAPANDIYIAQTAAGAGSGQSCANAFAYTFFNTAGNWGTGANQIGPGTTVHLCGTITGSLGVNGSGSPGNVVTIKWEAGARLSLPVGQAVYLNGSSAYLLFDGGVPCGPGTPCDGVEAASNAGYATGQAGIIEATANGSAFANHSITSQAFFGCSGCHDVEIKNLIIRNLYVHSLMSDSIENEDTGTFIFQCSIAIGGCAAGTISIHDSTVHDTGNAISIQLTKATTVNIYNVDFYRNNWAVENSGNGARTLNFHDNHIHDTTNWDTSIDIFHHNGLHSYMNVPSDSLAINLFNNLSDGNWGPCCTTATQLYVEDALPDNFNVFNNVAIQYVGNTAPAWEYGATNGVFANNTAIGVATTPSNVNAIQVYGAGISLENNTVQGYGQYIYVHAGTTFAVFDYNQWGPIGISGNGHWQWMATGANTLAAWRAACSCDAHGGSPAGLGVSSTGVPQAGSPLIGAGANLTGFGLVPLDSATSAGGVATPLARPASGGWDVGAYEFSSAAPSPPTVLSNVVH